MVLQNVTPLRIHASTCTGRATGPYRTTKWLRGLKDGSVAQFVILMGVLLHLPCWTGCICCLNCSFSRFRRLMSLLHETRLIAGFSMSYLLCMAVKKWSRLRKSSRSNACTQAWYSSVGFGFLHGLFDSLFVIELLGEPDDFGLTKISEMIFLSGIYLPMTTAQGYIYPSSGEDTAGEINGHFTESQSGFLRMVMAWPTARGIRRKMPSSSFYLFFLFVVSVAHVAPYLCG